MLVLFDAGFIRRMRLLQATVWAAASFVLCVILLSDLSPTWAAVNASGDVSPKITIEDVTIGGQNVDAVIPNLPGGGGLVTDDADGDPNTPDASVDLIVGGTGTFSGTIIDPDGLNIIVATTEGDVTINNPSGTLPLIAPNVTIGMAHNGRGRINLNDFGSTLLVSDGSLSAVLIIGEEGHGELKLTNGARVFVGNLDDNESSSTAFQYLDGETIIGELRDVSGDPYISEGIVTIDGSGSKLETEELFVAREGLGTVKVSGLGTLYTTTTIVGEDSDSIGRVSVSGLGTTWTNRETMEIGDQGQGILDVSDQGLVTSDEITIGSGSFVNLSSGGRLLLYDGGDSISNNGVIQGDGRIESALSIARSGTLSNTAGIANEKKELLVTGPVTNDGTIESLGGKLKFLGTVNNNAEGDIVARDAIMRFQGGLVNDGELGVGGDTTIYAALTGAGDFLVLPDSTTLLVGSLAFTPSSAVSLAVGAAPGTLDILGTADLGSSLLFLNYSGGVHAQEGDSYNVLSASGGVTGMFANTIVEAGGLLWDIIYGTDTVSVTATGFTAVPMGADFNGDGVVDSVDLAIWKNFYPIGSGAAQTMGDADGDGDVDGADFLKIQRDLGGPPSLLAAVAAVPEPSALVLALTALAFGYRRRK